VAAISPMTVPDSKLTFCESVSASGNSPWHLRWRTGEKKLGGGVDTDSLCGRVKAPHGWDLEVDPHKTGVEHDHVCTRCRAEYTEWCAAV
jgi:hypothetical protein